MSALEFLPAERNLTALREAASVCRGCELYKHATQTVFGAGSRRSPIMLVGEIPGDEEDRQGRPFVGPAGRLLRDAMEEAGIDPSDVYLTNAVKHFRWIPRGKRRLHQKPSVRQIKACKPWLEAEIETVNPQVIVCLGATAAQSLLGSQFRLTRHRGTFFENGTAASVLATYHPSAILRSPDKADRRRKRRDLVDDLRLVAERV